jgi:hypothetical protein
MIKNISGHGRYIQINGASNVYPYISSPGSVNAGQLRYNVNNNNLEVWDGVTWKEISNNYTSIGLNAEAEVLLDWARVKRDEDLKLKSLVEAHPGVRDLKEKLDILVALVQKEHDGTR